MKRFLPGVALILALFAFALPSVAGNPWSASTVLTFATDNVTSAAVALPKNISRIAIHVPTIESSTVFVLASADGGTTYLPWYAFGNGTNIIQCTTAASTGVYLWEVPGNFHNVTHLKVKLGTGQTANRTFKIYGTVEQTSK